jgi:hypothetical protein
MGKAYHTKHDLRKRLDDFRERREDLMEKNRMSETAASLSINHEAPYHSKKYALSRHPGGTKAKGLRKVLREKWAVLSSRDRFGLAEEKSSRLRSFRRYVHKTARQESKEEITTALEEENR